MVILVFAATAVEADRWARAHDVRGARCFGDTTVVLARLRFLPHDDVYVLPSTDPVMAALIGQRVSALDPQPRLHWPAA